MEDLHRFGRVVRSGAKGAGHGAFRVTGRTAAARWRPWLRTGGARNATRPARLRKNLPSDEPIRQQQLTRCGLSTYVDEVTEAVDTASAATSQDPQVGLHAVAALRRLVERLEILQVDNARRQGWSWEEIGRALGVSRQAVHKKHGRR